MVGAPGCGKGTQGEILEKKTKFKRIVMSDLIKEELKPKTPLYDKVINKGILLDDQDIFKIVKNKVEFNKNLILDGIPRTEDQAYWLYGVLVKHNYDVKVVFLDIDEKKLLKRITSRRYCPKCHRGYNILTKKPKKEGVCDFDNTKLIQREDDTAKVFSSRLKTYDLVKEIILKIYKGDIIKINGENEIEKVSKDIFKKLKV